MTQGQGPLNDPRLVERRGDLSGLNAALFVLLVIAAFISAAYLLATYLHIGESASPSPSGLLASPSPSASAAPPASPSTRPSSSSSPSPVVSPAPTVAIGTPTDILIDGTVVGTATVVSADFVPKVEGRAAGIGQRWLVARIRYTAAAELEYSPTDWVVVDATGQRFEWAGADPSPALGSNALAPRKRAAGNVTFKVPIVGDLWMVLVGADGTDRVRVPVP